MGTKRTCGAIGTGLALIAMGVVPAQAVAPLQAETPAPIDCAVVPGPGGAVYEVTASGDSGPGTFAEAIAQANASAGLDTVRFAPGTTVEVTRTVELTESVVIDGGGATVTWSPETDETESWIQGVGEATVAVYNLTINQTAPNWEPMIAVETAPVGVDTLLCRVTATNSSEGLLRMEESLSAFVGQQVTVDGSSGEGELAAIWIGHAERSVTLRDSTFKNLDMGGLSLEGAELPSDATIAVVGTEFLNIAVEESESPGLAIAIDSIENATGEARSAPAVTIVDTVLADVSGTAESGLHISDVEGDVVIDRSHVSGVADPDGYLVNAAFVGWVNGSLLVRDSSFVDNSATGLVLEEIEPLPEGQVTVERSLFERNASVSDDYAGGLSVGLDVPGARTTSLLEIVDSAFLDNTGTTYGGAGLDVSLDGEHEEPVVRLSGNTFRVGAPDDTGRHGDPLFISPIGNSSGANLPQPVLALVNNTVDVGAAWPAGEPGIVVHTEGAAAVIDHLTMPGAPVLFAGEDSSLSVNDSALGDEGTGGVISTETVTGTGNTVPASGALAASGDDIVPLAEWGLAPLADNGGPIVGMTMQQLTMLPSPESPLVDNAVTSTVALDQRGVQRPQGTAADRGAVEVEAEVELGELVMGADAAVRAGEAATLTVSRSGSPDDAASATVTLADGTAIAGTDYEAATVTLDWPAGDASPKSFTVQTLENVAGKRELTATITQAAGASIGERATATVRITQEDAKVPPTKPGPPDTDGPGEYLSDTGGSGPGWLLFAGFGALLLGVGATALALRSRVRAGGSGR